MLNMFVIDSIETAYGVNGVRGSIERRIPNKGHIECTVEPLGRNGRIMARRLPCGVRIYAGIGGDKPYAYVIGDSATARDFNTLLRMSGFNSELIC